MKNNTVIFDYNNLAKRCLYTPYVKISDTQLDLQMWRYMVWNSIFSTFRKLKATEVILAGDKHSWRKIIYPAYKMDRRLRSKKQRMMGIKDINWEEFYEEMDNFGNLLSANLPFKYITENNCEADDIIAIICNGDSSKNYTVVSVDSDYKQLTHNKNIKQWDPLKKNYAERVDNLEYWVNFNSLRGQSKDNIYNVYTKEDFPIEDIMLNEEFKNTRKPSLSEKNVNKILLDVGLDVWLDDIGPKEAKKKNELISKQKETKKPKIYYEENVRDRYKKNRKLIDFREIPVTLQDIITKKCNNSTITKNDDFYKFFKDMKWNEVLDNYTFHENTIYTLF